MDQHGCTLHNKVYEGFDSFVLKNAHVQLIIVPELGGKISSIIHTATQREWLWRNPHLVQGKPLYDSSYVETFDTGGLDECFPAVGAGPFPDFPWEGINVPDHGELWSQPWEVELIEHSAAQITLLLACHGVRFPYRFERKLTLTADSPTIRLDYSVTNLSRFDMPFVWSIHPLINIEPGMRVSLPAGIDHVRVAGVLNGALAGKSGVIPWPNAHWADGQPIDLSHVPDPEFGRAYKLFTPPLSGGIPVETAIYDPTGNHALTFRFSPQQISHVGIWMNFGAWSGAGSKPYFNLGLEPCIGSKDALADAKAIDEFGQIPAKQTQAWSLELKIT